MFLPWMPQGYQPSRGAIDATPAGGGAPLDGIANLTGAWSMGRALLTAYGGAFYTDVGGGKINPLLDQSGNARNFSDADGANQPLATTAGVNSRACARFDGATDRLANSAMSNFITASAGYIIVSCIVRAITTDNASFYLNEALWADAGGFLGVHLKSTGTTVQGYNYDGSEDTTTADTVTIDTAFVYEWYHTGGNLFTRFNGGTERSTANGDTTDLTNAFRLATTLEFSAWTHTQMDLFEIATFNDVPSSGVRNALVTSFSTWMG